MWSELGAALPGSGGTYHFLREIFRPYRWGRLVPFLFIWQFLISGTLEMASGYIGGVDYLKYAFPNLQSTFDQWGFPQGWNAIAALSCGLVTLGYSRIPYAAAREGDFFRVFARVHPRDHYPVVSLLAVSGLTAVFCFFPLSQVIDAAVTVRILVQFVGQIIALHILRKTRPDVPLPFRMWLYPIPSLVALVCWIFLWASSGWTLVLSGVGVIASGCVVFGVWQALARRKKSPVPAE